GYPALNQAGRSENSTTEQATDHPAIARSQSADNECQQSGGSKDHRKRLPAENIATGRSGKTTIMAKRQEQPGQAQDQNRNTDRLRQCDGFGPCSFTLTGARHFGEPTWRHREIGGRTIKPAK